MRTTYQPIDVAFARRLLDRGCTRTAIAEFLGVGRPRLMRALRKAGVPPGRPGRPPKYGARPPDPAQEPLPLAGEAG